MDRESNGKVAGEIFQILIVDDHPIVRDGLSMRISKEPDLEVCGEAESIASALQLVRSTNPDLAVIDISLKGGSGVELIKRIKVQNPSVRMLVSSIHDDMIYAPRVLRSGAMGYINKAESGGDIIAAIRRVLDGKIYLSEKMANHMLERAVGGTPTRSPIDMLSDRELETYELMGRGFSTQEIATAMHLSPKTIASFRDRISGKLRIGGSELKRHAMQWVSEND